MYIWTKDLSVGVTELDTQHQHLFEQIQALLHCLNTTTDLEITATHQLLDAIMNYNLFHMSQEEEYMRQFACVDEEHLHQHASYIAHMKELFTHASHALRTHLPNARSLCFELADFAGKWHVNHIHHQDKKYTDCFRLHGLTS